MATKMFQRKLITLTPHLCLAALTPKKHLSESSLPQSILHMMTSQMHDRWTRPSHREIACNIDGFTVILDREYAWRQVRRSKS